MEIFIAVVVVFVAFGIMAAVNKNDTKKKHEAELKESFPNADIHLSEDDWSFAAIDYDRKQAVFGYLEQRWDGGKFREPCRHAYPYDKIVEIEVQKNGGTVVSTNRGSQVAGAALGAIAFGGVGAIVGGLSGSSRSSDNAKEITLRVKVKDRENPVHYVTFFKTKAKKGAPPDSFGVKGASKKIEAFATKLANEVAEKQAAEIPQLAEDAEDAIVGQIGKLWDLKEKGALSQEEYETQKARLLAS